MGKGAIMKARFPLLMLLGIVFLASASVSFGLTYREKENPISHNKWLQSQGREEGRESHQPWRERGRHEGEEEEERDPREQPRRRHQEQEQQEQRRHEVREDPEGPRGRGEEEEEEEPRGQRPQTQREREREPQRRSKEQEQGRQESGEEEEEERDPWRQRPQSQREREQRGSGKEQEEEEEEWRGERRHEDPEERERIRRKRRVQRQREERGQSHEKREQREERQEGQGSQSQSRSHRQNNPFYFSSNRFQTRYRNRNGQIRVLQRFDQRSNKLQNLQNYRIVEYESKPNTLVLPHHSDAEYILVVLRGRATITIVNNNDRQAYNLERGDALRLPAGTTAYLLNRDDNQNLRVVKLAIPVNKPGKFDDFFPSSTQNQQSYFRGFSRNTLEAAFNSRYEEIQRILLGEEEREQEQQSQEEGVIVRVSKEQVQELSKHAQSISRRGRPSESAPFNLRSNKPIYSNKFGNFYEITPDKNPQLEDLELSLSSVEINKGALILPHYNSKAIVVVVVNEGGGNLELVGLKKPQRQQGQEEEEEQQEQEEEEEEEEGNRQVQRYRARLSPEDIFVVPAGYPVSVNASSNLHLVAFGINADNNQRNFLAGEDDNVISQLDRQVKELAFPGSAQDVESLINNQQQSYFASAKPQQRKEGRQRRKDSLASILRVFY